MISTERNSLSIIYIDDDEVLAHQTAQYLELHNINVKVATCPREGMAMIIREPPDLILWGLDMREVSGFDVCQTLRARVGTPIIVLASQNEETDCVMALEGGADDCMVKPFSPRELLARIRARIRRVRGAIASAVEIELKTGALTIEPATRSVKFGDVELFLTTYEFDLLSALARRAGRVLTREQLMDYVKGTSDEAFDRSVDVHISHVRKKLGDDPRNPRIIKTVRGVGYMLTERWDSSHSFA